VTNPTKQDVHTNVSRVVTKLFVDVSKDSSYWQIRRAVKSFILVTRRTKEVVHKSVSRKDQ